MVSSSSSSSFPMLIALLVVLKLVLAAEPGSCDGAVLFNFGDSNSDTGGAAAVQGWLLRPPIGRLLINGSSNGRLSDGRLIIDFLCESLNIGYLSPYLDSLEPDFSNGADFAIAGASVLPRDRFFSLYKEVHQFLRFKSRSLELVAKGSKNLITEEGFRKAIYMIDIGQNDLAGGSEMNYDKIVAKIPSILSEMEIAIKAIYDSGATKFWIHNTGPFGCLPAKLASPQKDDGDLDPYGCLMSLNNAAKKFNDGLSALCDKMISQLKNLSIVYTDIYAIKYDLIAHSAEYGFESPLMACCGYGGPPYNYNESKLCGNPESKACSEGSRYISWDGVHYTEAVNTLVASNILSTNYTKPRVSFDYFCNG